MCNRWILKADNFAILWLTGLSGVHFSVATAEWKFATNATDFNRRRMKEQQNLASKFECLSWRRASRFDTSRILDPNIRRQLGRVLEQGKCGLGDDKYLEVSVWLSEWNRNVQKHEQPSVFRWILRRARTTLPINQNSLTTFAHESRNFPRKYFLRNDWYQWQGQPIFTRLLL